ncbi:hypothetical protein QD58_07975 [Salmonella enterica]|nr:hypothetical protein [Salmonella enterica]EAW9414542.1 hypothetical protein [Salmonella enterica]EDW1901984.1 hypothetical protein [Salmonella enterica subsp. enterica serovar Lingwala]EEL9727627.1 hypothetical protein [Salmonella enterica subsp. enterica serovar Infantis]
MKNHLGASKGAYSKMKQDKFVIFQYTYRLCFVPIIAPSQSSSNKLFFHNNLLIFFLAYLLSMV